MIPDMKPLHIAESDWAGEIRAILQCVETGAEVIVERDARPVAVIRAPEGVHRKISEGIALMPPGFTATIDATAAVAAERQGKNARQLLPSSPAHALSNLWKTACLGEFASTWSAPAAVRT